MSIKVNTAAVVATADQISNINNNIRADFSPVEATVGNLGRYWSGSASERAIGEFRNIRNTYKDARYDVINQFVTLLHIKVGDGYDSAEEAVQDVASAFK